MKKVLLPILALILAVQFADAQTAAQRRSASLGKGMNFSLWLEDYYSFYLSNVSLNFPQVGRFTEADVAAFKALGFNSVRLPVLFEGFVPEPPTAPYNFDLSNPNVVAGLNYVDSAIKWCSDNQMILVIDNHIADDDAVDDNLEEDYGITNSNYTMQAALIASVWKQAIARYEYSNPDSVIFEIRNEPNVVSDADLVKLYQTVIDTIRKYDTKHTLVVGTSGYYDPYELAALTPYSDTNIIYTTHIYNGDLSAYPGFCFQGNGGVAASDTAAGQRTALIPFGITGPNDADSIEIVKEINTVAAWGTTNNKPVWLSEFGSTTLPDVYHDDTSRCNYFGTLSGALKKVNMPWSYWNGWGPEGLYTSYDGGTTLSYFFSIFDASNIISAAHLDACFASDFQLGSDQVTTTTWTAGAATTNWFTAGNWSNGVPTSTVSAIIPSAASTSHISPDIASGTGSALNLTLNTGGVLTVSNGASLDLYGNLSNSGTASLGTGTVAFIGSSAQTISGNSEIYELLLNNTLGASLLSTASLSIFNAIDLQKGNFNATSGTLTLLSTSVTQAGIIDNFSAGYTGTLSGAVTAQRYYASSETYNQHMMGSPVNSPLLSQFGASGTTGYVVPKPDCDESQMATGSPYGTVFSYHESAIGATTCGLAEWYVDPASTISTNGQGYSILKVGNGTLNLTGTPNLNASYSLSGLTNSNWSNTSLQNRDMTSGWQLVSNPYSATLNITTVNAAFDNQIQVWNANGAYAGTYQVGTIDDDAIVAPFQAFMVHATNPGSGYMYTIKASDRVRTSTQFYAQHDNELNIVAQNTQTGLLDQTTIGFDSRATDGFDPLFDANKMGGALNRHTLYSLNNNKWMARNVLNSMTTTNAVAVGFEPGISGNYTFTFNGVNSFDPTSYIFLEDKKLNVMYNVRSGNYNFTADINDEWNRFEVHFTPPAILNTANAGCDAPGSIQVTQPGPANWNFKLTDAGNNTLASGVLNQASPININVQAGNYTLLLSDNNNYSVTKMIQVSGLQEVVAGFNISANNVNAQTEIQFINASQNASSLLWNFGDGTSSSSANPTHIYSNSGTYTATLTATGASGCSAATSQTIKVSGSATGINSITENGNINMWSNENRVYVDFTRLNSVNAIIRIYDILGREISNDKFTSSVVYQKEINNIEAAYVIVSVINEGNLETRKLFISNSK